MLRNLPIRRRMMTVMLLTSGLVLTFTCAAFIIYESLTFRGNALRQLATLGQIVALNSTAALAFENTDDARETLAPLRVEPNIVSAVLFDIHGRVFARYPEQLPDSLIPGSVGEDGYRVVDGHLVGIQPVAETATHRLGTLYLRANMSALSARMRSYGSIALLVFGLSLLVAYLLSRTLQRQISRPVLALAEVARAVSDREDYSVRAPSPGRDELGQLTIAFNHMLGQIHDRSLAVEQIQQDLVTTLDSIADAVIATDTSGVVVRLNPVAEALTGWTRKAAVGQPLSRVFHLVADDNQETVGDALDRLLRGESATNGSVLTVRLKARNGVERPISVRGAPMHGPAGDFRGVVLVFRDETEARRTHEVRVKSQQLEAQNQHVMEATRLKSEFLANMSHELRTPLNGIIGFAEILHDGRVGPLTPEQKLFLGDVLSSGQHLLRLINDVLDLSKVEAGKLEFRPEAIDLERLTAEVLGVLRTTTAAKSIVVTREIDPELRELFLDASRLKQVLYNYVSNALKFTPDGGRVTVRARPMATGTFRLEVQDTGAGIARQDLGRLFVEFQQLDSGAAKRHGGTGLGLALTKRLVEAQGGTIGVESTLGEGSTFYAVLPRHARGGTPMPPPRGTEGSHPDSPSILVIEDDDRDQAILVRILTEAGFAVDAVATGAQAIARCQEHSYAAITLDLLLPDMSGLDVLREIGKSERNRLVPVIVVTVVTEDGATGAFAVHDLLPKPLEREGLLDSLNRAGVRSTSDQPILIVEDDPASAKLMAATLTQMGHDSVIASSGMLGLELADHAPPAAIILDLMMPGMDGFEFLDRLRQLPRVRLTPVIVWTIKDLSPEEHAMLRSSASGVVAKGRMNSCSLVDALRTLLPKRRLVETSV